jgi:hypothetical protein
MRKLPFRKIRWFVTFALTILLGLSSLETECRAFGLNAPSIYLLDISTRWMIPVIAKTK